MNRSVIDYLSTKKIQRAFCGFRQLYILLFIILPVVTIILSACEFFKTNPGDIYSEALTYYENGQHPVALTLLNKISSDFPDSDFALLAMHRIELIKRDHNAQNLFSLAEESEKKGDYDKAYEEYLELVNRFKIGRLAEDALQKLGSIENDTTAGKAFAQAQAAFSQMNIESAKRQFSKISDEFYQLPIALKAQEKVALCESILKADKYYKFELYPSAKELYKNILENYPDISVARDINNSIELCDKNIEKEEKMIQKGDLKPLYVSGHKGANLRVIPSLAEFDPLTTLSRGTVVSKIKKKGKWYKVRHPKGITGWIHASVVSESPAYFTDNEVIATIAECMTDLGIDIYEIKDVVIRKFNGIRTLTIDTGRYSSEINHLIGYFLSTMPVFLAKQPIEAVVIFTKDNQRIIADFDILWQFILGKVGTDYFFKNGFRIVPGSL